MQELIELVRIVNKNKIKQIEILSAEDDGSSVNDLYQRISHEGFKSEEEAAKHYYGNPKYQKQYFNRLKNKLKERLYNTLFFIDINEPHYTDVQRAFYTCHKYYAISKILIGRNSWNTAIRVCKKALELAVRFEFSDLVVNICRSIRIYYGAVTGNSKELEKYDRLLKKHFSILEAELIAEDYYTKIAANFIKTRSVQLEYEAKAAQYEIELRSLLKKFNSYRLLLYSYYVIVLRYQIANDHTKTLEVAREALNIFENRKHPPPLGVIFVFNFYCLSSLKLLGSLSEGYDAAKRCKEVAVEGSSNWYAAQELHLLIAFQNGDYLVADEIFATSITNKQFAKLPPQSREIWKVYNAYLEFLRHTNKVSKKGKADYEKSVKKFKLGKFLNEVPNFSKDKRGINIPIIIIQVLFLLQQKKFGQVIDKVEALNMYCHRYLRKDDTFRSNCFIKMLLQVPAARFHRNGTLRKTKKLFDKLLEMPLHEAKQSSEIEIIPYEVLWEYTLELLDNKFH